MTFKINLLSVVLLYLYPIFYLTTILVFSSIDIIVLNKIDTVCPLTQGKTQIIKIKIIIFRNDTN